MRFSFSHRHLFKPHQFLDYTTSDLFLTGHDRDILSSEVVIYAILSLNLIKNLQK